MRCRAPTTATIVGCGRNRGGVHCTGTWCVGGVSHKGPIEVYDFYPDGSSLDVHASCDSAYMEPLHHLGFYVRAGVGVIIVVLVPLAVLRRRTDR